MSEFSTSLLREKFIIHDAMPGADAGKEAVVALSNRLSLPLKSEKNDLRTDRAGKSETLVVRAQNMHSCVRYGAALAKEFQEYGPLVGRDKPFDFAAAYNAIVKGFEEKWNPQRWIAVYHKGRVVFESGPGVRHPFLDIIEQCDSRNKAGYDKAVKVAEDAFKQAGRQVSIEHDSNIALVVAVTPLEGKVGAIVRGPSRTTTFNMVARTKAGRLVRPSQCLSAAAAYLEGIQLAFFVGMAQQKVNYDLIDAKSDEAKKAEEGRKKLGRLNSAIAQFESMLDVNYRPDRPDFALMIDDAVAFARKAFAAEIEKKIREGGKESGEWIV